VDADEVRFYRDIRLLQPPRRVRGRSDDTAFISEHVERLRFIRRAVNCGLTHEDIAELVDPEVLVTCGDACPASGPLIQICCLEEERISGPSSP
jgi:hypothetical protein